MLRLITEKVKTLIFDNESQITTGQKRKRAFDECSNLDEDVQIISVKKQRLQQNSSQSESLIKRIFSAGVVQNMSDWVQKKTPTLNLWGSIQTQEKEYQMKGIEMDKKRQSDLSGRIDRNGGSHHVFQRVGASAAYTSGNWPVVKHSSDQLCRRSIHAAQTDNESCGLKSTTVQTDYESGGLKSTAVQTNNESRGTSQSKSKRIKARFKQLFNTRDRPKFTAMDESIRMGEKMRYHQLLQQFTTVPLEPPDISHPIKIQKPVVVPQLPRFYFNNNDCVLGSKVTSWEKIAKRDQHVPKIKAHHMLRSTRKPVLNGTSNDQSVIHVNDISAIPLSRSEKKIPQICLQEVIDLTVDDDIKIVLEERPSTEQRTQQTVGLRQVRSPVVDYRDSELLSKDWLKDLNNEYDSKAKERQRQVEEEELRVKVFEEERKRQEIQLERKIWQQLRIYSKEPWVEEEPEPIELEDSEEEEEEEIEDFLPELTNEMENRINDCLKGGMQNEVLVAKFRLEITRKDMMTLSGLNWLNDEIINFYMNLLMERGEKDGMPKVYACSTFFYPKVKSGGQSAVKRWTRRVDIFAVDYILVPVHLGMHWCLAVIDFKKKDIQYYDSMGGSNTECLDALRNYLCDESLDKKKTKFDLSGWKCTIVKDIPQQMNGSDCGMFACKFADYITREKPITFSQQHMPYFRRRMVYEIVTAKLLQ